MDGVDDRREEKPFKPVIHHGDVFHVLDGDLRYEFRMVASVIWFSWGGMAPVNWVMANYVLFVHAVLGSLAGGVMRGFASGRG